ncbi:PEP-CTERM sorting domain-containing protein [Nodularia harveyana UHCC-0300]|uniref:PEP-CTERM sorting domain-containing protein n=1 Tax=Nodularia harveyana UHCC-0300 TaxID=2974287 RepID=A0ABU5UBI7_9CYAN|nr:PEP-CTERM sorting domain-containing protein [Nodularia harveyana]MEA5580738.1 PEP-CTERM sorting domain-containing protein [Nodularia harveyana UHCC-0300]
MNSLTKFLSHSAFTLLGLSIATVPAHALTVETNNDPNALINNILGGGINFSNPTYTGAANASGIFTNGLSSGIGIDSGIILTTGDAEQAQRPVIPLPIEPGQNVPSLGVNNFVSGDDDLSSLLNNADTFDSSVLEFDFISQTGDLFFNYAFASQEYPVYVNSQFNDVFAFFVNGQNVALIPGTTTPVSINTVNGGNPNPQSPNTNTAATNSEFFNDNNSGNFNNGFNGFTTVFTAQATGLVPGATNSIKLAIADTVDGIFDSAVFIESGTFSSTPVPPVTPVDPRPTSVPEPTTMLGLLVFGAFGASSALKRKQQSKAAY